MTTWRVNGPSSFDHLAQLGADGGVLFSNACDFAFCQPPLTLCF
jgi:hypothetical protein